MRESHRLRSGIIIGLVVALVAGIGGILHWNARVQMYQDETVTGNTSANLLNGGLFAESGDTIFFANPEDDNALYAMDADLGNIRKIHNDYVSYINASGKYIFYTRRNDKKGQNDNALFSLSNTGLYRINTSGKGMDTLYREPTQSLALLGNYVLYQRYDDTKGLQLFRVRIDGEEESLLLEEGVAPVVSGNTLYYTGVEQDHNIHQMASSGGSPSVLYEGNFTGLSCVNGILYCMDMDNDYTLCRLDPASGELTHLTQERVASYNVSGDGTTIYFQIDNGTENGLYALDAGTGTQTQLRGGNFNYLHIIGEYLFFEDYTGSTAYVMELSTEQIQEFHPGAE